MPTVFEPSQKHDIIYQTLQPFDETPKSIEFLDTNNNEKINKRSQATANSEQPTGNSQQLV